MNKRPTNPSRNNGNKNNNTGTKKIDPKLSALSGRPQPQAPKTEKKTEPQVKENQTTVQNVAQAPAKENPAPVKEPVETTKAPAETTKAPAEAVKEPETVAKEPESAAVDATKTSSVNDTPRSEGSVEPSSAEQEQEQQQEAPQQKSESDKQIDVGGMDEEGLEAESVQHVLSADEQARIDDQKRKLKAKNEGKLETEEDEDDDEHKREKDPFKKGDVIDYMYEEWFLKGLTKAFDRLDRWARSAGENIGSDLATGLVNPLARKTWKYMNSMDDKIKEGKVVRQKTRRKNAREDTFTSAEKRVSEMAGKQVEAAYARADEVMFALAAHQVITGNGYDKKEKLDANDYTALAQSAKRLKFMAQNDGQPLTKEQEAEITGTKVTLNKKGQINGSEKISEGEMRMLKSLTKDPASLEGLVPNGKGVLEALNKTPADKRAEAYSQQMEVAKIGAKGTSLAIQEAAGKTLMNVAEKASKGIDVKKKEVTVDFGKNYMAEMARLTQAQDPAAHLGKLQESVQARDTQLKAVRNDVRMGKPIKVEKVSDEASKNAEKMDAKELVSNLKTSSRTLAETEKVQQSQAKHDARVAKWKDRGNKAKDKIMNSKSLARVKDMGHGLTNMAQKGKDYVDNLSVVKGTKTLVGKAQTAIETRKTEQTAKKNMTFSQKISRGRE